MSKFKDSVLATVTHDLKSPLNGMMMILGIPNDFLYVKKIIF